MLRIFKCGNESSICKACCSCKKPELWSKHSIAGFLCCCLNSEKITRNCFLIAAQIKIEDSRKRVSNFGFRVLPIESMKTVNAASKHQTYVLNLLSQKNFFINSKFKNLLYIGICLMSHVNTQNFKIQRNYLTWLSIIKGFRVSSVK